MPFSRRTGWIATFIAALHASYEWNFKGGRRVWELRAPACCVNDAPVASHQSSRRFLMNSVESSPSASLRFETSSFDSRPCCIFRKSGGGVGAFTTHVDGILGCGETDLFLKARSLVEKGFGEWGIQEKSFVRVGVGLGQERDFSATLTQEASSNNLKPPPTTPEMWAGRDNPQFTDDTEMRQCKLGELRWVAAASRPDICACLARIASRVD